MSFNSVRLAPARTRPARRAVPRALLAVWAVGQVVAFARWVLLTYSVGATCDGTVYVAVSAVPLLLADLATVGILAALAAPAVGEVFGDADRSESARLVSWALCWTVILLVPLAVVAAVLSAPIASWLVRDLTCTGAVDLASAALPWAGAQVPVLGLAAVLGVSLFAGGRVGVVGSGAAGFGIVLGAAYLVLGRGGDGPATVSLTRATTVAAVLLLLVYALAAARAGLLGRPSLRVPPGFASRARPLAVVCLLVLGCQTFAVVAVVITTSRAGVGVLVAVVDTLAAVLLLGAILIVPVVKRAIPTLPETAERPRAVELPVEESRRARRERLEAPPGPLSAAARRAAAFGAVGAGALAAMARPLGALVAGVDAGRGSPAVQPALDAIPMAAWALSPTLVALAVCAILAGALQRQGRIYVAGGAVGGGWLIAGAAPLAVVMPGATAEWTALVVGVAISAGAALGALELAAATTRAVGGGMLTGLGRTLVVSVLAAALAGVVGFLGAEGWPVTEPIWYAAQTLVFGAGGAALVALAVAPVARARRSPARHGLHAAR